MAKLTKSLESATRKKIDVALNILDWNTDEEQNDCNVFTERAKTIEQNKLFKRKKPDYVLYESGTDNPIGIIEAKRKGESIEKALDQAVIRYAKPLKVNIVFVYDSTFILTHDLRSGSELKIDSEPVKELISEKRLLRFITHGSNIEEVTPEVKHTREELIKIFKWSNDLLRKEGLRNLDRFIEFSNILFIKIISEIETEREDKGKSRMLPKDLCWESFSEMPNSKNMLNYINKVVLETGLADKYNHSDDIFRKKLKIENPETVKSIVQKLSNLKLLNTESEIKGDAFEYFLKSLSSGNDLGEYFTPRHIVSLMVQMLEPKVGETVFDPFCGTGGFLIEAFRQLKRNVREDDLIMLELIKEKSIFGVELTDTYKIAKMNMIITGDGHNNIVQADAAKRDYWDKFFKASRDNKSKKQFLRKLKEDGFDIILANIPYGQMTDYGNSYPVSSKKGDSVFVQEIIRSLNNGGRAAIVIPEGLLFAADLKKTRKYILETCAVDGIISLPSGVFQPYTGVKTNILVITKGKPTKKIWYFKVENDGFTLNVKREEIDGENDIDELNKIWKKKEITQNSFVIDMDQIKVNDYNLAINRYKKLDTKKIKHRDPKVIMEEMLEIEKKIMKELTELKEHIK